MDERRGASREALRRVQAKGLPRALLRLGAAVVGIMMVLDVTSMMALERLFPSGSRLAWHLVASWVLVLLLLPVLYRFFLRPFATEMRMREEAEGELREIHRNLEREVEERTAELRRTNEQLEERIREANQAREEAHVQAVLLDAAQEVIVATDLDGRLTYWNQFAAGVFGLRPEDQGRSAADAGIDWLAVCRTDEILCTLARGESWRGETELRGRGRSFPALTLCSPVRSSTGELVGTIAVASDLSARKRIEEALRESEHLYSTVTENSLTGIFITVEGKILYANQELARMLGYRPEELLGTASLDYVHPEDRARVQEYRERRKAGGASDMFEIRCLTRTGDVLWVASRNVVVQYEGRTALLGNLVDVTDKRRAEAELVESEAQLRVLSGQLIQAQESERARVARDLHDGIGQTLTAIKFLLENGMERIQGGESPEAALGVLVPRIKGAVEEVRRICMDLRPAILDELGVLPTIGWFCREFQEACPQIRVERRLEVEEDAIPEVLKITVYRLLQEAMNNVAKHSGADEVRIYLGAADQGLLLAVEDDGRGLREGAAEGAGFGLKSMRRRTQLSGGTFALRSGEAGGARVEAFWPAEALRRLRA